MPQKSFVVETNGKIRVPTSPLAEPRTMRPARCAERGLIVTSMFCTMPFVDGSSALAVDQTASSFIRVAGRSRTRDAYCSTGANVSRGMPSIVCPLLAGRAAVHLARHIADT